MNQIKFNIENQTHKKIISSEMKSYTNQNSINCLASKQQAVAGNKVQAVTWQQSASKQWQIKQK